MSDDMSERVMMRMVSNSPRRCMKIPSYTSYASITTISNDATAPRKLAARTIEYDDPPMIAPPKPVAARVIAPKPPDPEAEMEAELRRMAAAREAAWKEEERDRRPPRRDRTARRRMKERAIDTIEIATAKMPAWKWFFMAPPNWALIRLIRLIR